jgi:type I restriction enzyme S subunit
MRAMKDSESKWIGAIPQDWTARKLKYCVDLRLEKTNDKESSVPYIGLEHVSSHTGKLCDDYEAITDFKGDTLDFRTRDILFGKLRPYLAKAYQAEENGRCSSEFWVMNPKGVEGRFLLYYVLSHGFISDIDHSTFGVKMPRAEWNYAGNVKMPFPSHQEQIRIANYLDAKCSEIDALIAAKEQTNALLKERRQSIIYEAVTKGLDPTAPMKDSGVEWIGKVPDSWNIERLKHHASFNPTTNLPEYSDDDEVSFIPMDHLKSGFHNIATVTYQKVKRGYVTFQNGDILMAKVTPCLENGNLAIAKDLNDGFGFGSTEINVIRSNSINRQYLFYLLQCPSYIEKATYNMFGVAGLKRLEPGFIPNSYFPIPPVEEQQAIVEILNSKCASRDEIMRRSEMSIKKLKDYRQSLIYEAVTGKIEV